MVKIVAKDVVVVEGVEVVVAEVSEGDDVVVEDVVVERIIEGVVEGVLIGACVVGYG